MASIGNDPNGRRRILFVAKDGSRKTVRLGKATRKQAEAVKTKVESLVTASLSNTAMDDETARWVADLPDAMHDKLARAGLVVARKTARCAKLGAFLDDYIAGRCDVKPATLTVLGHTRRNLVDYFGASKPLDEITPGDADNWRLDLIGQGLADNTVRRRCGIAKQFFRAAMRSHHVKANPFADLSAVVKSNAARVFYVTRDMADAVIEACPDAEWKLIFALCRFGGLRCPSEVLRLRWGDVNWEKGRFTVHASKTEHHDDGGVRVVPIFPELYPHLLAAYEEAEEGAVHVVTRYRQSNVNLRTQLSKIIARAGLTRWPKLFQNLRSSRETELCEVWPEHVVTKWIGNSPAVAREHYLQVTEEHFERAAMRGTGAAQNAAQKPTQDAAENRNASQPVPSEATEYAHCERLRSDANDCNPLQDKGMGLTGLEPVTLRV